MLVSSSATGRDETDAVQKVRSPANQTASREGERQFDDFAARLEICIDRSDRR